MASGRIHKYPRTRHVSGSRLQPGDEDLDSVPFGQLRGRHLVIEEKMDGANCAVSFDGAGTLQLQSRGHYLTGGARERHFDLFKQWAAAHERTLLEVLGDRYVMYGEWLYAKHTLFYDWLPHFLMEFDVLDTHTGTFLDTPRRAELLAGLPVISVKVLFAGELTSQKQLRQLVRSSHFMTDRLVENLRQAATRVGVDPDRGVRETDLCGLMEGLYIKVEGDGEVQERLKFVRADFLQKLAASDSHWHSRPIIPNQLADGVDIWQSNF